LIPYKYVFMGYCMIYESVSLPVPARCALSPIGKRTYVYYHYKPSERIDGKLKHYKVNVGRYVGAAESTKMFHPNDNYYQWFKEKPPVMGNVARKGRRRKASSSSADEIPDGQTKAFGFGLAAFYAAREYGITEILKSITEDNASVILTCASYMARGHGSFTGIEHFCQQQMSFCTETLQPHNCGMLLSRLDSKVQTAFFKQWIKRFGKERKICYDVTSLSTYSRKLKKAAYGYNRDKEKLKQVNIGLFADYETNLPLFLTHYNGNINDFTNFPNAMLKARAVGIDSTFKLVMDGIFSESKTVDFSQMQGVHILVGTPIDYCPGVREEFLKWRMAADSIKDDILNNRPDDMSMKSVPFTIGGTAGRLLMYYFDNEQKDEESSVRTVIKELKAELDRKRRMSSKQASSYRPYFKVKLEDAKQRTSAFTYEADIQSIKEEIRLCGCMGLFSTDKETDQEKELATYREKDIVEKMFDTLKNDICHERAHMRRDAAMRAKLFLCFLALIIRRVLRNKLADWIREERLSLDAAFEMLEDIEIEKDGEFWFVSNALTKQQKAIVNALGLPIYKLAEDLPLKVKVPALGKEQN